MSWRLRTVAMTKTQLVYTFLVASTHRVKNGLINIHWGLPKPCNNGKTIMTILVGVLYYSLITFMIRCYSVLFKWTQIIHIKQSTIKSQKRTGAHIQPTNVFSLSPREKVIFFYPSRKTCHITIRDGRFPPQGLGQVALYGIWAMNFAMVSFFP